MAIPIPSRQLFIDGEWREPVLKKRILIINPSTEQIIEDIPAATAEDVELAVVAARRALLRNKGSDWASASGSVRARYLRAIAAKTTARKSELAKLEAIDCGKPLIEAVGDIADVAGCFEYYADLAEKLDTKQKAPVSLPMETFKSYILKEPIGVIALITPWNYPLLMGAWKVAPALAAGCTAILKPSELSSITCLELAEVCREVGLPPGVLNILTGLGPEAGAPLASHPQVEKIAFTGSSVTGSKTMTAAAQLVKPVSLELGGKSPIVVFEDVDLDKTAECTIYGCFFTNGQICSATSRLIVHKLTEDMVGMGTILVMKVSAETANQFGELVADPITNELLHYTEKPETFVSDWINCGVYIFTPVSLLPSKFFPLGKKTGILGGLILRSVKLLEVMLLYNSLYATWILRTDFVRLDQDILSALAGKKQFYIYETMDFWEQIKTPGMSLKCSGLYLAQFHYTLPHLVASGDGTESASIIGDVYIHPSAKVHPSAKIGSCVSISANAHIGAGARLISCIILDGVEIKENAIVIHAIVGWKSSIGKWARVQASGDYNAKFGVTILGESVWWLLIALSFQIRP